jgi:hypothetical protein
MDLEEEFGIVDIEKLTFDIYPEIIVKKGGMQRFSFMNEESHTNEGNREVFLYPKVLINV